MAHAHPQRRPAFHSRAFTLIELLVVTGIIVVITGVVLVSNNRFGGVVLLENLAYDIALSIRQAQVYGISVQRFQTSTFDAGYGVHFDLSSTDTYVIFADAIDQDGLYSCPQPGTNNCELVRTTTITGGYRIRDLCYTPFNSSVETCDSDAPGSVSSMDVLFKRPDPDAFIGVNDIATWDSAGALIQSAIQESGRIELASPRGDTASIVVQANGQIAVQK